MARSHALAFLALLSLSAAPAAQAQSLRTAMATLTSLSLEAPGLQRAAAVADEQSAVGQLAVDVVAVSPLVVGPVSVEAGPPPPIECVPDLFASSVFPPATICR